MIVFLLLVIAAGVALILANSNKRTETVQRMERQLHDSQHGSVPDDIAAMVRSGEKAAAMKLYRQRTGCSFEIAMARINEVKPA